MVKSPRYGPSRAQGLAPCCPPCAPEPAPSSLLPRACSPPPPPPRNGASPLREWLEVAHRSCVMSCECRCPLIQCFTIALSSVSCSLWIALGASLSLQLLAGLHPWLCRVFLMHGGVPPASITQSGLATGREAFMVSRSSIFKGCAIYNSGKSGLIEDSCVWV